METPLPRLLVIDDDFYLRGLFKTGISKEGFEVGTAADGLEGLDMIASFKPDIILLDLMMPILNGFAFIDKVKERGCTDIPIVIMTGYWEETSERRLRQEPNVFEVLKKPLPFTELADMLHDVLAKRK